MKKLSNILSSLLFFAVMVGLVGSLTNLSAQTPEERNLADFIKTRTNRSSDGLTAQRSRNGSVTVDLQDRFQNMMLARVGYDGSPEAACVTSLEEANVFFRKDLETGRLLAGYESPFDNIVKDEAARHGMSPEELTFYKNLIQKAAERLALSPDTATITIVNNDGAGEGFNDPTAVSPEGGNSATTRGAQRLAVFQAAATIWGTYLDSSVNIQVRSQFDPQTCTSTSAVLGSAGTRTVHRDFPTAEATGVWYHQALANKREGTDLSANEDINATFNSALNGDASCLGGARFYLGFDNTTPANTVNLLVVLLHEFGHGLGFSSFANGQTGALFQGFPDVYTTRLFDRTTNKYWNNMTDTERAASAINTNNLMWDGENVKIASSFLTAGRDTATGRVQMYTPNPFSGGSSVSHWSTAASPNLLMEPFINLNIPLTLDLTTNQLRDVGWYRDTNLDRTPDSITGVTPSGGSVPPSSTAVISWSNNGGFNKNVTIDLSTDGGATYPTRLATNVANSGSFTFTVPNTPTTQAKIRVREHDFAQPVGESASVFTIGTTVAPRRSAFDFDGDGKTDVGIFRPSTGAWWVNASSNNVTTAIAFGASTDKIVPADFTGDGKTDIALFRESSGQWFILRSEDNTFYGFPFGAAGDKAVPADFDGDGKADPTVFRSSNSGWYSILSSNGSVLSRAFGVAEDVPLPNDYDGDGKADLGVFRPSTSAWWIQRSSNNSVLAAQFGATGDKPVPADFTGDGKTDFAFFRPSSGQWFILRSEDFSFYGFPFGAGTDTPVVGDYDGDGKADAAVFRDSNSGWYLQRSTAGFIALTFGTTGDKPIPSAYLP